MMKATEIRKILAFCKQNGVKRIKVADFYAEFGDAEEVVTKGRAIHRTEPSVPAGSSMPPDSKMLFMSTPFFENGEEDQEEQTAS